MMDDGRWMMVDRWMLLTIDKAMYGLFKMMGMKHRKR